MRPAPGLLLACLLLLPSAGAASPDVAVAGLAPGTLTFWDGQGNVVVACEVTTVVALKFASAALPPPLPNPTGLVRPTYVLQPVSLDTGDSLCLERALLSPRIGYGEQTTGNWDDGWTLVSVGDADILTLTVGPYGTGHGIAFTYLQSTLSGAPEVGIAGSFDDLLAGP